MSNKPRSYLVGGAVRDRLLGLPVNERDWVVVGSTPEAMEAAGFRPVGKDFPVFLHPQTQEEYALARTERKQGRGYHGFVFHTGPEVRLEDDLLRRDLTINAIAEDEDGRLIDPLDGQGDIHRKQLRHASDAFVEDPVRLLRLARFYARFQPYGFSIAQETLALAQDMVESGEVDHLQPERVWNETRRALDCEAPQAFFSLLRDCGALARLFPELDAMFGVPQTARWHPEIDAGVHALMALEQAARQDASSRARFAVLCHDFGKAVTPEDVLPSHRGHEKTGLPIIEAFCDRLRVPNDLRDMALLATRWHLHVHRFRSLKASTIHDLLQAFDALRRPDRLEDYLAVCAADLRGRLGFEELAFPAADYLREAVEAMASVSTQAIIDDGHQGPKIGEELRRRRIEAIKRWKNEQTDPPE